MLVRICDTTFRKVVQTVQNSSGMAEQLRGKAITRETQGVREARVGRGRRPQSSSDCEALSALMRLRVTVIR
jgi:transposase-like protein